jgi:hypothetical protein
VKDSTDSAENDWKNWIDRNEAEIPEWMAILDSRQRPIDAKNLNRDELIAQFQKRFVALLQKSGSIDPLDRWRDVAIDLALEFHPAFKIKEQKALPVSGRPITSFRWMIKIAFLSRKRKLERNLRNSDGGKANSKGGPGSARDCERVVHG